MNRRKTVAFFLSSKLRDKNEVSKAQPLLKGRETEGAAKNISGPNKKACNGSSLTVVRQYQK